MADNLNKNIFGEEIETCSKETMTGYLRNGSCETLKDDIGSHTVCAIVTDEFLEYSRNKGNDLMKKTIDVHPEFGIELTLALPYAYWLHQNDKLNKVITSKDMKPFYYFCDNVEERYTERTVDNAAAGLNSLPNNWLHHNAWANFGKDHDDLDKEQQRESNGFLDYSQWTPPPLEKIYKNDRFVFEKPIVNCSIVFLSFICGTTTVSKTSLE